jgi:hypothetical protein
MTRSFVNGDIRSPCDNDAYEDTDLFSTYDVDMFSSYTDTRPVEPVIMTLPGSFLYVYGYVLVIVPVYVIL